MRFTTAHHRLAGIIGNFLEHYDNALFGLLAPFIAPLFFQKQDPVTALILTYGMMPLGLISKPLGSLFFGWMGDCYGRRQALCFSLLGMAIVTIGIGCLPVYEEIGMLAPLFLAVGKMLQSFCAAGETTGGALFVLEHTPVSKRTFLSSCYDASSIGGFLLASSLIALMSTQGDINHSWRILFWIGGLTAVFGLFFRWRSIEAVEFIAASQGRHRSVWRVLKDYKMPFIGIILVSGFMYTTYSLAFTLMNGYIPLITSLSKTEVMQVNTLLLIIDFILLLSFGYVANKIGKEKVMLAGALGCIVLAVPLFSLLDNASLSTVISVRLAIIICGVAFAAPYYAWAMEQVPPCHRYLILAFGGSLGSQLIGIPTPAISLWLYQSLGWTGAPALYLLACGSAAGWIVYRSIKADKPIETTYVDS